MGADHGVIFIFIVGSVVDMLEERAEGRHVVIHRSSVCTEEVVENPGRVQRTKASFPSRFITLDSVRTALSPLWVSSRRGKGRPALNQQASKDAERQILGTKHAHGSDSTSGQPFAWISTKEIRFTGQPRSAFGRGTTWAHPFSLGLRSTPPTGAAVRLSCPVHDGISPRCG